MRNLDVNSKYTLYQSYEMGFYLGKYLNDKSFPLRFTLDGLDCDIVSFPLGFTNHPEGSSAHHLEGEVTTAVRGTGGCRHTELKHPPPQLQCPHNWFLQTDIQEVFQSCRQTVTWETFLANVSQQLTVGKPGDDRVNIWFRTGIQGPGNSSTMCITTAQL